MKLTPFGKCWKAFVLCCLCALFSTSATYALADNHIHPHGSKIILDSNQDNSSRFTRAVINTNTQNDGAILQDHDGFLWIGTNGSGWMRFDSNELKIYKPGGANPFPDAIIMDIVMPKKSGIEATQEI
jgi:CheY-like chemotaxis protein